MFPLVFFAREQYGYPLAFGCFWKKGKDRTHARFSGRRRLHYICVYSLSTWCGGYLEFSPTPETFLLLSLSLSLKFYKRTHTNTRQYIAYFSVVDLRNHFLSSWNFFGWFFSFPRSLRFFLKKEIPRTHKHILVLPSLSHSCFLECNDVEEHSISLSLSLEFCEKKITDKKMDQKKKFVLRWHESLYLPERFFAHCLSQGCWPKNEVHPRRFNPN